MTIPADYENRVYAGVLGKIIGVYLGRPFEGWSFERIMAELGEINYYVHDRRNLPLVVPDDDISGTFTFVRALEDYGNSQGITAADIGQSWLNYAIENRSIFWWGGMGNSTEHTAYLRLKQGIKAPDSGSIATNGKSVAEQIGAQIFIDGWALVAPGDPQLASSLARRAASVSHDGEAIYGAQIVAAMESLAFVESDLDKILDAAVTFIPADSVIRRVIDELREYHAGQKTDWKKAFADVLLKNYGYDKFGGGCHMVPNHGLIILSLLYGDDDFQKSLKIVNTCGWDTDCNSGNVGCFMGIKKGLAGIDAGPDWRGPVADRIYVPTADGGACVTDAVIETYRIANIGRALAGQPPVAPKDGARFHFSLPGSVQGFMADTSSECRGVVTDVFNADGSLGIVFRHLAPGRLARVGTATLMPPETFKSEGYKPSNCPTIYPGQRVRASVLLQSDIEVTARLYWKHYDRNDAQVILRGPDVALSDQAQLLEWTVPFCDGQPIVEVGIELASETMTSGIVKLQYLTWDGEPDVVFHRPAAGGPWSKRAWVDGVSDLAEIQDIPGTSYLRLIQNEGRGLAIQGTRQWRNYRVATDVTPHLAKAGGLAVRVQGMQRYYALLLCADGQARLVKMLDGQTVLATAPVELRFDQTYHLIVEVQGTRIRGWLNTEVLFDVNDAQRPLTDGAIGLVCEEGRVIFGSVSVKPG